MKFNFTNKKHKIDLHGFRLEEAKDIINDFIDFWIKNKDEQKKKLTIITGKGIHSKNGPVIRPYFINRMKERKIKCYRERLLHGEYNDGCFYVYI